MKCYANICNILRNEMNIIMKQIIFSREFYHRNYMISISAIQLKKIFQLIINLPQHATLQKLQINFCVKKTNDVITLDFDLLLSSIQEK